MTSELRDSKGRFVKGLTPWNKNTIRVMKPNKTSFKDKNGNMNPDGRKQNYYRRLIFEDKENVKCNKCDKLAVLVHHKDENFKNNDTNNLEPLCKSCHSIVHETWRNFKCPAI